MNRRALDFRSFDEVLVDLDKLRRGYTSSGTWNLSQTCWHLSAFFRGSLEGFNGKRAPWILRQIAPMLMRRWIKKRRFPAGFKTPSQFQPPATANEAAEIQQLRDLIARFQKHSGPLHPSLIAGDMSYEDWREMHLIHCSLHLSFLHPTEA